MCPHVRLECIRLYTGEVALCATAKLFPWMNELVLFELIGTFARKVTLLTHERLFYRLNMWVLSEEAFVQENSHCCIQMKGFSPEWISMCVLKLLVSEQEKFHCVQLKGFFPEWVKMWLFRWLAYAQEKLHYLQTKDFSPLSTSMCLLSLKALTLEYPQLFQLWDFFLTWWSKCIFKSLVILKERSRWTQEWGLSSVCISIVLSSQFSLCWFINQVTKL